MQKYCAVAVTVGLLLCCGCHHYGYYPKRQSELNCPTDIRQTVPWCAGEDAVFHCPCGPSPHFYGHKPTCWGYWPAPGSEWRDSYCGCPVEYSTQEELRVPTPVVEPLPESNGAHSENSYRRPVAPRRAQQHWEPLFVPPQPSTADQSRMHDARLQNSSASLGKGLSKNPSPPAISAHSREGEFRIGSKPAAVSKRGVDPVPRLYSEGIQQACHTEEVKLESHAWTGVKFIR